MLVNKIQSDSRPERFLNLSHGFLLLKKGARFISIRKLIVVFFSLVVFLAVGSKIAVALVGSGVPLNPNLPDTREPDPDLGDSVVLKDCACGEATKLEWDVILSHMLCQHSSPTAPILNKDKSKWEWVCTCPGLMSVDGKFVEPERQLSCSASYVSRIVNGVCGPANGISSTTKPSFKLCLSGQAWGLPDSEGKWNWKCIGQRGGKDAFCSALIIEDGKCGLANGQIFPRPPTANLCEKGIVSDFKVIDLGWSWICRGRNGGQSENCQAKERTFDSLINNKKSDEFTRTAIFSANNDANELSGPISEKRKVFLISEYNDWRDILSLVPVSTWMEEDGRVYKYPVLIYSQDGKTYDPDSAIYFMQQFKADSVYYVNFRQNDTVDKRMVDLLKASSPLGAGIDEIEVLVTPHYFSFWESYDTIVYSADNYEYALQASVYASMINAPLIIQGGNLDHPGYYADKKLICVGVTKRSDCYREYQTIDELHQAHLAGLISRNINDVDLILTNPLDYNFYINAPEGIPKSEKSGNKSAKIFGKHSLTTPFLASAKHQLLITYSYTPKEKETFNCENNPEYCRGMQGLTIEKYERLKSINLSGTETYLTIVGDPHAVSYVTFIGYRGGFPAACALDADYFYHEGPRLLTGRMLAYNLSDLSSLIGRSIFYDVLMDDIPYKVSYYTSKPNGNISGFALLDEMCPKMEESSDFFLHSCFKRDMDYYDVDDGDEEVDGWRNASHIYYHDHASFYTLNIFADEIPEMNNAFINAVGCDTAQLQWIHLGTSLLNSIRKGALHYSGTVSLSYSNSNFGKMEKAVYTGNYTIGEAFYKENVKCAPGARVPDILIGDPTIMLKGRIDPPL